MHDRYGNDKSVPHYYCKGDMPLYKKLTNIIQEYNEQHIVELRTCMQSDVSHLVHS